LIRLRWTAHAADDLKSIKDFIAQDSPTYAQQLVGELYTAVGLLTHFPDSGRMVPERGAPDIRELIRSPYRLIYRRRADLVEVLTIHHASRPLPEASAGGAA
jgi:plasmid stabilization system protein ParE